MTTGADPLQNVAAVRADILALLREKRYEETLAALYRARAEAPLDRELQKSIEQVKEFLIGTYAKRLGGLDRVAAPIPLSCVRTPDAVMLARYIDGVATFGDLAQMCPLGRVRTLQVLVGLYQGSEPLRIYGMEAPRVFREDDPRSGLRVPEARPESRPETPAPHAVAPPSDEARPPDTSRSASVSGLPPPDSETTRSYKENFSRGTAAFVQGRFTEAVEAFEVCAHLRPDDPAATMMIQRARRGGSR